MTTPSEDFHSNEINSYQERRDLHSDSQTATASRTQILDTLVRDNVQLKTYDRNTKLDGLLTDSSTDEPDSDQATASENNEVQFETTFNRVLSQLDAEGISLNEAQATSFKANSQALIQQIFENETSENSPEWQQRANSILLELALSIANMTNRMREILESTIERDKSLMKGRLLNLKLVEVNTKLAIIVHSRYISNKVIFDRVESLTCRSNGQIRGF